MRCGDVLLTGPDELMIVGDGLTRAAELLSRIRRTARHRSKATLAIVFVGAGDVQAGTPHDAIERAMWALLNELHTRARTVVCVADELDQLPIWRRWWLRDRMREVNAVIERVAMRQGAEFLDRNAFTGDPTLRRDLRHAARRQEG